METITVREIVDGQKNLDRMKEEILTVTSTTLQFSRGILLPKFFKILTANCEWDIEDFGFKGKITLSVKLHQIEKTIQILPKQQIPIGAIEIIHNDLQSFIFSMIENYPNLLENLRWHRSAALKKF